MGIIVAPDVFASNHEVIIQNAPGSSTPGCEQTNDCFIPSTANIAVGNVVTWENNDNAAHTSTSGDSADGPSGVWDSSLIMAGGSFSNTFEEAGIYPYFCMVHPWMAGVVNVTGQGGAVPDTGEKSTGAYGTVETEKSQYELRRGGSAYVKIFGTAENPGSPTTEEQTRLYNERIHIELTKPDGNKLSVTIPKTRMGYYETVMPVNYENLGSASCRCYI